MKKKKKLERNSSKRRNGRAQGIGHLSAATEQRNGREWGGEISGMYKPIKKPVTLRLDADVLAWFKAPGKGYQTRINRALRQLVTEAKKGPGKPAAGARR